MQLFPSDLFDWHDGKGRATLQQLGLGNFPSEFTVVSTRTNMEMIFRIDIGMMEANEFFDGEASVYRAGNGIIIQIWY